VLHRQHHRNGAFVAEAVACEVEVSEPRAQREPRRHSFQREVAKFIPLQAEHGQPSATTSKELRY